MTRLQRSLKRFIVASSALVLAAAVCGAAVWASPRLAAWFSSDREASDERALSRLRAIAAAQSRFWAARPAGEERFAELSELVASGFLSAEDGVPTDDSHAGLPSEGRFRYQAEASRVHPEHLWWAAAEDLNGRRCFYLNQGGVIYASERPIRPRSEADTEPDGGVPVSAR